MLSEFYKQKLTSSQFIFFMVFHNVCLETLSSKRLNLIIDFSIRGRCLAHGLILAEEDTGVAVDPILKRFVAVIAFVNHRLKLAVKKLDFVYPDSRKIIEIKVKKINQNLPIS